MNLAHISRTRPFVLVALIFNTVSLSPALLETSKETQIVQNSLELSCSSPSLKTNSHQRGTQQVIHLFYTQQRAGRQQHYT